MTNHELWQAVLAELELTISKANFSTWFKNTAIISCSDGRAMICIPNSFTQAWIEKKYHHLIIRSLERITGKPIKRLEYVVDSLKHVLSRELSASPATVPPSGAAAVPNGSSLNPKYAFESFVVGKGSELAHAAAQAVAARPGEAYNPFFIYGGVGLGKTHLLQATGNEIKRRLPLLTVLYLSAEKFSNEYIIAIREKTVKDFHRRYREADVLLIDDIQFISGKDGIQESFFHTFNELHQQNKQIIIASDRPPKAIPALEGRLKSRFEWGLIADVAPPDFETRLAILERKCAEKRFPLDSKVLQLIASTAQHNVRELEGALNKIIVYHEFKGLLPTVESVRALLSAERAVARSLPPAQVLEVVGEFYNLSREELVGKNREKKVSLPRQIIMFLLREELKLSYPAIGEEVGGRDHTTAMHAYEKIFKEVDQDQRLKQDVELIKQRLYINRVGGG